MPSDTKQNAQDLLFRRYGHVPEIKAEQKTPDALVGMLGRGSCRAFLDKPVPMDVIDLLCAAALASPTKSDLQQRDIIILASAQKRAQLAALVSGQAWVRAAPMLLVICGNNRRQRLLHEWHDVPFANDHLDAFFNATADAAIALGAFVTAVEALGLGCCPISAVRNEAADVSKLLGLPQHVFPFAGLALGYPAQTPEVSPRLPLAVTCHVDGYAEQDLQPQVQRYDAARQEVQPYTGQRFADRFGASDSYGWSEDKVRQYSAPERADFGAYVRARGFKLD